MRKWLFTLLLPFFLALWLVASHAQAQTTTASLDDASFSRIPILHGGRIKPLDTFARAHLQRFYGRQSLPDKTAAEWLAETLFTPQIAMERQLFQITSPRIIDTFNLPERKHHHYSYMELAQPMQQHRPMLLPLLEKDANTLALHEKELLELYEDTHTFSQLTRSLSLLLPTTLELSPKLLTSLGLPENTAPEYMELIKIREKLMERVNATLKAKGDDIISYTTEEQQAAALAFYLSAMDATGRNTSIFRVIPSTWDDSGEWFSPWDMLEQGKGSPDTVKTLQLWESLAYAYHAQDATTWAEISHNLLENTTIPQWKTELEYWHNLLDLLPKIIFLYALAFFLALIRHPIPNRIAVTLLGCGLFLHITQLVARILILGRPPVSNLYESILFVALIAAAFGLWPNRQKHEMPQPHRKTNEILLIGSLLGTILLAASFTYAPEGDSMNMLIAVLNTNFWLATHVICITIGYGCCLVSGTLAHVHLMKSISPGTRHKKLEKLLQSTALVALMFTALGTILGGIWADQSWGRFWGWDPKENGALLIVLWLVWVLHGKLTEYMSDIGFSALLAGVNIVVALSWFGVNLLNVGLHSYGFTDAAAIGLAAFCIGEAVLITALYFGARGKALRHA